MRYVLLGTVFAFFACGGGGEQAASGGEGGAGGMAEAQGPRGDANVVGVVNFEGTAPENPTIDMAEEPSCAAGYEGQPRDPQVVVTDGKLGNVFVYVKGGLPADAEYTAPSTPVVLDQEHCLYEPRVFGVMVGQPVEITNSDSLLHNIKAVPSTNRGFNISQPTAGISMNRTFSAPEIMVPFECNVHGWMHAFAGVTAHPFYDVSADDGSFTLERLPAGTYEIEAWHERFGTKTQSVTVPETGQVTVEFTFSPETT
jgi:plastocyanin